MKVKNIEEPINILQDEDDIINKVNDLTKSLENFVEALNNYEFDKILKEKKTGEEKR